MIHQIIPATCLLLAIAGSPLTAAEPAVGGTNAATTAAPEVEIGSWKVAVTIPKPPVAGKMLDVDLTISPATPAPKAVRLWVGKADARGSVNVKADAEAAGAYCVGVEVPDPLPAGAQVWISLEAADGVVAKGSATLPASK